MIVVVGNPSAARVRAIAGAVSGRGARAEVVGPVARGEDGDRVLQSLAALGVGHAAVLRTSSTSLDVADLDLALRYLPEMRVVVVAEDPDLAETAAAAAAWAGATLIVLGDAASGEAEPWSIEQAIVLAAPARDPDGAFAGVVADLAVRLDQGQPAPAAWTSMLQAVGAVAVSGAATAVPGVPTTRATSAAPARPGAPRSARRGSGRRS